MSHELPDSIRYSNDPDIRVKLSTPEGYRELVAEYADDPPEDLGTPPPAGTPAGTEPPQPGGTPDPAAPAATPPKDGAPATGTPAAEPPKPSADTPPASDEPLFTEAETKKLMRVGLIDEKGKFLGRYPTVEKMIEAVGYKDRAISSKFADFIAKNPDIAKDLFYDTGVVATPPAAAAPAAGAPAQEPAPAGAAAPAAVPVADPNAPPPAGTPPNSPQNMPGMPGTPGMPPAGTPGAFDPNAPTPEQYVDNVLAQTLPTVTDLLAVEFKTQLEEIGVTMPKDRTDWYKLADMSPGLHAELRERYWQVQNEQKEMRSMLLGAAQALTARKQNRPAYEQDVLTAERAELAKVGYPEELITRAQAELLALRQDDAHVDLNYYDDYDAANNRLFVPVLRKGALRHFISANHSDELLNARVKAEVAEKLQKEADWRASKERRANLFPPTMVGQTGEGRPRTAVHHPTPTPDEYWDAQWRDAHLRTEADRLAVKNWIDAKPQAERDKYRFRN